MSSAKQILKLKTANLLLQSSRSMAIRWGGLNHVVAGPPQFRIPFWKKIVLGGIFVSSMFTYPLYITYRMHEWDLVDPNPIYEELDD